jgi:hypothetical protein
VSRIASSEIIQLGRQEVGKIKPPGFPAFQPFQSSPEDKNVSHLDEVTFADPRGLPPPTVSPADVDDLYQTGGPLTARGLGKQFRRVIYRVSEIGDPKMRIRDRVVAFKREVGFGGGRDPHRLSRQAARNLSSMTGAEGTTKDAKRKAKLR